MAHIEKVSEVLLALDATECGYRIVELECGEFAFVWGNVPAKVGDVLSESAECEKGHEIYATAFDAKCAWARCAGALKHSGAERACAEMMDVLRPSLSHDDVPQKWIDDVLAEAS